MVSATPRDAFRAFTTTCALITTEGPQGPNVMAAEWTFNVSYDPFLILVLIDPENRTHDMILESKEFGVNLVADDQVTAMAFAGHYSKADTDKLSSEAFRTFPAKKIKAPMIQGSVLAAECRLVDHYTMGDHTAFLGEVLEFTVDPGRNPVVLHHGSRTLGERVVRGEGAVVAVTPMTARPGETVTAVGELTGAARGIREIELTLSSEGPAAVRVVATSDAEGGFRADLALPPSLPPGEHTLVARSGSLQARARLHVQG